MSNIGVPKANDIDEILKGIERVARKFQDEADEAASPSALYVITKLTRYIFRLTGAFRKCVEQRNWALGQASCAFNTKQDDAALARILSGEM